MDLTVTEKIITRQATRTTGGQITPVLNLKEDLNVLLTNILKNIMKVKQLQRSWRLTVR